MWRSFGISIFLMAFSLPTAFCAIGTKEPVSKLVERAFEFLPEDRARSAAVLISAIEAEPIKSSRKTELKRALKRVVETFITDKAHKKFESARAEHTTNPSSAAKTYQETLTLEPGHMLVLKGLSSIYLTRGDCDKVLDLSREMNRYNPYDPQAFLFRIQSKVCLKNIEDIETELSNPYVDKSQTEIYVLLLKAQYYLQKNATPKAQEELNKAIAKDPQFPESQYWMGQIAESLKIPALNYYEQYLKLCEGIKKTNAEKYALEPRTCLEVEKVEGLVTQIKKEEGQRE